jgi:ribosomal protein S18 acetylase RimI-like enzyme
VSRVRVLDERDRAAVDRFLARHADSSLFLRSNLAAAGFADSGAPLSALYLGVEEHEDLVALVALCWNGVLLLQAPAQLDALLRGLRAHARRPVAGVIGPWSQVLAARRGLAAEDHPTTVAERQILQALDLADLRSPPGLDREGVVCRRMGPGDLAAATRLRAAFARESLHLDDEAAARAEVERWTASGVGWLLEVDGAPVACASWNAKVGEVVQIGSVYTPPEHRGRGLARAVVAGSLRVARQEGLRRAVLFVAEDNRAAARAYRAIGFEDVGELGMIMFREGLPLAAPPAGSHARP